MVERRPIQAAPIKNADLPTAAASNGGDGEVTLASPLPLRVSELEKRISVALADDSVRAATLANLLQQTEWALPEAEQYAAVERDKSLDPTQSPDPRSARAASEDAQLTVGRIQTLQSRLRSRYQQVYQQEAVREYLAKLAKLAPQRDALAAELRATFQQATDQLIDLFSRVRAFEQRARQELGNPPANCAVLERIDTRCLDKCVLPDLQHPDKNVWPPPASFAADYVLGMGVPQHPGAAWADPEFQARRRAEIAAEQERIALHHTQAAKEQEIRQNKELREQWEARRNGRG